jgi:hypothetical protein
MNMKEVIKLPDRQYPQTETRYTCGRCKKPSGESEETRSSYDVVDTTIELRSGQKIELSVGAGKPAELTIHNIKAVKISTEEGSRYPECASINHKIIDCCSTCFEEHVIPALVALGFDVREENTDW